MSEATVLAAFAAIPNVASAESFEITAEENPLGEPGKAYVCFFPVPPGLPTPPDPSTGLYPLNRAKMYLADRIVNEESNVPWLVARMTALVEQCNI